ncbi:MAG: hypothetical protein AAFV62_02965 [Pseudomonadota bacterium]
MEIIVIIAVLAALLYLNRRILGLEPLTARIGGAFKGRACRWKRDPTRGLGSQTRYVCRTCGVDVFSSGGPPRQCRKHLRGGL